MSWLVFRALDPAHRVAAVLTGVPVVVTICGAEHALSTGRPARRGQRKCAACRMLARIPAA